MGYVSQSCIDHIHKELKKGGRMTTAQLVEASGYKIDAVREAIRISRLEHGSVKFRISGYIGKTRIYAADGLPDLPRDLRRSWQKKQDPAGVGKLRTLETIYSRSLSGAAAHPFLSLLGR